MLRVFLWMALAFVLLACQKSNQDLADDTTTTAIWAKMAYFRTHLQLRQTYTNLSQTQQACLLDDGELYDKFAKAWLAHLSVLEQKQLDEFYQSLLGQKLALASWQAFNEQVLKQPSKDKMVLFDVKEYQAIATFYQSDAYQKMLHYMPANIYANGGIHDEQADILTINQIAQAQAKRCRLDD